MQDPLKQGLKLCRYVLVDRLKNIRMQDPLKQGLKLDSSGLSIEVIVFECKIH